MTKEETERLRSDVVALIGQNDSFAVEGDITPSFSCLLENFVHLEFTEEDAILHWKNILENAKLFDLMTGRAVNVYTAVVDYFTNINPLLSAPLLVEVRVFRQTEQLAMIDGLTGLFNRRYMDIILKKEFTRCDRYSKEFSVCILDIDNFKNINDTRGHAFGDQVLRELSALLRSTIREEDIACRYGGEEFLIIIPETDTEGALVLGNRIRDSLKDSSFFVDNCVTFSAGTATYPKDAHDLDALVHAADMALYQAKFSGKDCVHAASPERRKFDRFDQAWSLNIAGNNDDAFSAESQTHNVSAGGIQFESTELYPLHSNLHFVISRDGMQQDGIKTVGRVTWIRKKRGSYQYGVHFEETPEVIESQLSLARKPSPQSV